MPRDDFMGSVTAEEFYDYAPTNDDLAAINDDDTIFDPFATNEYVIDDVMEQMFDYVQG